MKVNRNTKEKSNIWKLLLLIGSVMKKLRDILKLLLLRIYKLHQQWNEAWLLVAAYFGLHYVPVFLPEPTHRFFYATVGTIAAHFVVSVMLRLSHPIIFKYLYGLFYNDVYEHNDDLKSNTLKDEQKLKRIEYSLLVVMLYLGTWLILVVTC